MPSTDIAQYDPIALSTDTPLYQRWLLFRENADGPDEATHLLYSLVTSRLPADAPPEQWTFFADPSHLRDKIVRAGWETHYQRVAFNRVHVTGPVTERLDVAKHIWEGTRDRMQALEAELVSHDDHTPTVGDHERYRLSLKSYLESVDELKRAEQELREHNLEGMLTVQGSALFNKIHGDLQTHYQGRGPVYDLLSRQVAEMAVKLQTASQSGRTIKTSEYVKMHEIYTSLLNQFQKYTETTKSESLSKDVRDMALEVLSIVEEVVSPVAPELWLRVVEAVRLRIGGA